MRGRDGSAQDFYAPHPEALERLRCIVLNGCQTDEIGRALLEAIPNIAVVCWESVAEDSAARQFAVGFYASVAQQLRARRRLTRQYRERLQWPGVRVLARVLPPATMARIIGPPPPASDKRLADGGGVPDSLMHAEAIDAFNAGCYAFLTAGFRFGDPADYLHEPSHPHFLSPDLKGCAGCTPPVHGSVVLMYMDSHTGEIVEHVGDHQFGVDSLSDEASAAGTSGGSPAPRPALSGLLQKKLFEAFRLSRDAERVRLSEAGHAAAASSEADAMPPSVAATTAESFADDAADDMLPTPHTPTFASPSVGVRGDSDEPDACASRSTADGAPERPSEAAGAPPPPPADRSVLRRGASDGSEGGWEEASLQRASSLRPASRPALGFSTPSAGVAIAEPPSQSPLSALGRTASESYDLSAGGRANSQSSAATHAYAADPPGAAWLPEPSQASQASRASQASVAGEGSAERLRPSLKLDHRPKPPELAVGAAWDGRELSFGSRAKSLSFSNRPRMTLTHGDSSYTVVRRSTAASVGWRDTRFSMASSTWSASSESLCGESSGGCRRAEPKGEQPIAQKLLCEMCEEPGRVRKRIADAYHTGLATCAQIVRSSSPTAVAAAATPIAEGVAQRGAAGGAAGASTYPSTANAEQAHATTSGARQPQQENAAAAVLAALTHYSLTLPHASVPEAIERAKSMSKTLLSRLPSGDSAAQLSTTLHLPAPPEALTTSARASREKTAAPTTSMSTEDAGGGAADGSAPLSAALAPHVQAAGRALSRVMEEGSGALRSKRSSALLVHERSRSSEGEVPTAGQQELAPAPLVHGTGRTKVSLSRVMRRLWK